MLVALYLLYRIAYPKQAAATSGDDIPSKETKPAHDVIGKSRFVLSERSQPLQTPATQADSEKVEENVYIFAADTEKERSLAIPAEQLDEVFGEGNEMMSIPLDDEDGDMDFEAEDDEPAMEHEAMYADGYDFEDLQQLAQAIREQPETVNEQTEKILVALEHSELLEMLADGEDGKVNWIKSVVDRHIRESVNWDERDCGDFGGGEELTDFEISDFLK